MKSVVAVGKFVDEYYREYIVESKVEGHSELVVVYHTEENEYMDMWDIFTDDFGSKFIELDVVCHKCTQDNASECLCNLTPSHFEHDEYIHQTIMSESRISYKLTPVESTSEFLDNFLSDDDILSLEVDEDDE